MQINDRYEFPVQLDLDRENGKYLSPDADRRVRNLYTIHRLLVVILFVCLSFLNLKLLIFLFLVLRFFFLVNDINITFIF